VVNAEHSRNMDPLSDGRVRDEVSRTLGARERVHRPGIEIDLVGTPVPEDRTIRGLRSLSYEPVRRPPVDPGAVRAKTIGIHRGELGAEFRNDIRTTPPLC
jgi:hypothetical protein